MNSAEKISVLYLVSHPIQYQVPSLRLLAKHPETQLKVCFYDDIQPDGYHDKGFGVTVKWDIPLVEGYEHEYLSVDAQQKKRNRYLALWQQFRRKKIDVLWLHGYAEAIHWWGFLLAKCYGAKIFVRGESIINFSHSGKAKFQLRPLLIKTLNTFVDHFLSVGKMNHDSYLHYGVPADKITLVPYSVDNDFFQARSNEALAQRETLRASLQLEPHRPIILYASKMQPRKYPGDLLEAYIRLVNAKKLVNLPYLLFIGEGELRPQLEARAQQTHPDSIKFLGFKNQSELPLYFTLSDCFVLPSVRENWGLIVNEIMNAGRPVILTHQVGCIPDLIRHGINGMIYHEGDVDGLTQALYETLRDPAVTKQMGDAALAQINQWSPTHTVAGFMSACHAVSNKDSAQK